MTITLMICFARSGGTVLNQCLGSIPNVVILSEVNPLGGGSGKEKISYQTIKQQAKHWYEIELKSDGFAEEINELYTICQKRKLNLIVRDWTFANFVPIEENQYNPPQKLLALEALQAKYSINSFAFVRDAIDVWISRGMPPSYEFFNRYLKYVEAIINANIPILKYENFCQSPEKVIKEICNLSKMNYKDFRDNYRNFEKVNGDIQLQSRGRKKQNITPLPRKLISFKKIREVNQCESMIRANSLLNYSTYYHSVPQESLIIKSIKSFTVNANKIWRKGLSIDDYFTSKL